jgi:hypothetical protein
MLLPVQVSTRGRVTLLIGRQVILVQVYVTGAHCPLAKHFTSWLPVYPASQVRLATDPIKPTEVFETPLTGKEGAAQAYEHEYVVSSQVPSARQLTAWDPT